eukprot:sb/3465914/
MKEIEREMERESEGMHTHSSSIILFNINPLSLSLTLSLYLALSLSLSLSISLPLSLSLSLSLYTDDDLGDKSPNSPQHLPIKYPVYDPDSLGVEVPAGTSDPKKTAKNEKRKKNLPLHKNPKMPALLRTKNSFTVFCCGIRCWSSRSRDDIIDVDHNHVEFCGVAFWSLMGIGSIKQHLVNEILALFDPPGLLPRPPFGAVNFVWLQPVSEVSYQPHDLPHGSFEVCEIRGDVFLSGLVIGFSKCTLNRATSFASRLRTRNMLPDRTQGAKTNPGTPPSKPNFNLPAPSPLNLQPQLAPPNGKHQEIWNSGTTKTLRPLRWYVETGQKPRFRSNSSAINLTPFRGFYSVRHPDNLDSLRPPFIP